MGKRNFYIPRGELRDYLGLVAQGDIRIAVKPQYIDKLPKIFDGRVSDLLEKVDDRGRWRNILSYWGYRTS